MNRLFQFECQKDGTLFYFQALSISPNYVMYCPVCGSKLIQQTGRTYPELDELTAEKTLMQAARLIDQHADTLNNTWDACGQCNRPKYRDIKQHDLWRVLKGFSEKLRNISAKGKVTDDGKRTDSTL